LAPENSVEKFASDCNHWKKC